MKFMDDAVSQRGENDAQCGYEHQAYKEAVASEEKLTAGALRHDVRSDAADNQSRIQNGIMPVRGAEHYVSYGAHYDSNNHHKECIQQVHKQAAPEVPSWQ